jgi:6-phosphogluconolactonase (cycloisomerase 2 family)
MVYSAESPTQRVTTAFLDLVGSLRIYISALTFTTSLPSLSLITQTTSGSAPGWLTQSTFSNDTVYAADELEVGYLNSFVFNKKHDNLTQADMNATQGQYPTHIGAVLDGTKLGATNY